MSARTERTGDGALVGFVLGFVVGVCLMLAIIIIRTWQ